MVDIIPQRSFGQALGESLGQGATNALQLLLQSKLKSRQDRERAAQISSILGGVDVPGTDTEIEFLNPPMEVEEQFEAQTGGQGPGQGPGEPREYSNEQILALSQYDPNLAKVMQAQKDTSTKEKAARFKETKEARKRILEQARAAQDNDRRLGRMKKLNDEGKLISAGYNTALKALGLDYAVLKNADSQEFDKLTADFLRNAKEIFGARVTNFEIEAFLRAIPTLSQTKEGRDRVIRNLQIFNKGAQLRANAMKQIMKENRGTPPYDLEEQIEERIGPELSKISQEFIEGPVQKQQQQQSYEQRPSAAEFKGKIVRDTNTGERFRSNGKEWEKIE